jgi:hypothetical protein
MSKTPSVIKVISEVKKMNPKKQTHSSNWKGAHGCTVLSSQHNDRQRIILNLQSRGHYLGHDISGRWGLDFVRCDQIKVVRPEREHK